MIIEPAAFADGGVAFPTTRIAIRTDGDPATIERVRTAMQVALPTVGRPHGGGGGDGLPPRS